MNASSNTFQVSNVVQVSTPKARDYRFQVEALLKTILLLDEKYGLEYISTIAHGNNQFLRRPEHESLETFALLNQSTPELLHSLLYWMIRQDLVRVREAQFGVLSVTPKGRAQLDSTAILGVHHSELDLGAVQRFLCKRLKDLRVAICAKFGLQKYEVYSNFVLMQIVFHRPLNFDMLVSVPGLSADTLHKFGYHILRCIEQLPSEFEVHIAQSRQNKLNSAPLQLIKNLFLSGMDVQKIAHVRNLGFRTVIEHLSLLHEAGQINLKSYIETSIDKQQLNQGIEFFQQTQQSSLREAYEALGLDYETLKLCRLYVSQVSQIA